MNAICKGKLPEMIAGRQYVVYQHSIDHLFGPMELLRDDAWPINDETWRFNDRQNVFYIKRGDTSDFTVAIV